MKIYVINKTTGSYEDTYSQPILVCLKKERAEEIKKQMVEKTELAIEKNIKMSQKCNNCPYLLFKKFKKNEFNVPLKKELNRVINWIKENLEHDCFSINADSFEEDSRDGILYYEDFTVYCKNRVELDYYLNDGIYFSISEVELEKTDINIEELINK